MILEIFHIYFKGPLIEQMAEETSLKLEKKKIQGRKEEKKNYCLPSYAYA